MTMERKKRLWTTEPVQLIIGNAAAGQGTGQLLSFIGGYKNASGREPGQGLTVSHVFLKGFWRSASTFAATPVVIQTCVGMGIFSANIDAADMPNMARHEGDWFLHDARPLKEPFVAGDLLFDPHNAPGGAVLELESRAQRKLLRRDDALFLYIEKDIATEQDVVFDAAVTILWLYS